MLRLPELRLSSSVISLAFVESPEPAIVGPRLLKLPLKMLYKHRCDRDMRFSSISVGVSVAFR